MAWRGFGLLLMIVGITLFAVGVWVEFEVQAQIGCGLRAFLAWSFYRSDIATWRLLSIELMIAGPPVYLIGHLLFHIVRRR
jgi:hypothetical protein